ncbi:cbb3-type cytochrome oxidase assembly protein CcoS [Pseudomonadota bacterium]
MDTIYALVPAMILLALASVAVFFWASRSGQYDDMEGPAHRILNDDDDPLLPDNMKKTATKEDDKSSKL